MPKLPVPSLEHTQNLFLHSSAALLTLPEMSQLQTMASTFFAGNDCQTLHNALVDKANKEETSWLRAWWEVWAYLSDRSPIAINSNYIIMFGAKDGVCNPIARAARMSCAAREFADMIDAGALETDKLGGRPLCMKMYKTVFRTCRIPGLECDSILTTAGSKHMVVVRRERFYRVELYNVLGAPLPVAVIERQLQAVTKHADDTRTPTQPLASLTAVRRDDWSKARDALIALDPQNKECLSVIESALFVLCLDERSPNSPSDVARLLLHGDGQNRFFDKSVQLIVFDNGLGGINAEHSPSDAPIIGSMLDYAILRARQMATLPSAVDQRTAVVAKELVFKHSTETIRMVKHAHQVAGDNARGLKVNVLRFTEYGTAAIKKWKMSPDAWAQMAMQLAFFRNQKCFTATYETGSTRMFDYGRTECIRSCSVDSVTWVNAMENKQAPPAQRRALLLKALDAHRQYTALANEAKGCDRHLLGMRLIAPDLGMEVPAFLTHPLLKRSSNFRLSTSNISRGQASGGGFGPVLPDGYGICYGLADDLLQFIISDFVACKETDAFVMGEAIAQALRDMRTVMESAESQQQRARL